MEAILYELGTLRIVRRLTVASPPPGAIFSHDMKRFFMIKSTSEDASRAFYVEQAFIRVELAPTDPRTAEPEDGAPLVSIDDGPTAQVIDTTSASQFVDEPPPVDTFPPLRNLFDD